MNLDGRCCEFFQYQVEILLIRRLAVDSIGDKMVSILRKALVLSEMEEIEVAWLAILMPINKSRIGSSLKKFYHDTSLRSFN